MRARLLRRGMDRLALYFPSVGISRNKMAEQLIDKSTFLTALNLLDDKLQEAGRSITFLCVGGAMMMLSLGTRDATHDIDGLLRESDPETTSLFHRLVAEVAAELGIENIWINTQVKSIMAGQSFRSSNFETLPEYQWENLRMLFAKPGYMLSMKIQALRVGSKDFSDIVNLLRALDIRSMDALQLEVGKYGDGWSFVGNDEFIRLKLAIAWAFPRETEYDHIRVRALEMRKR